MERPRQDKGQLNVTISADIIAELRGYSEESGVSISRVVEDALRLYIMPGSERYERELRLLKLRRVIEAIEDSDIENVMKRLSIRRNR